MEIEEWAGVLIAAPLYLYVLVRVISTAYFQCKLQYSQDLVLKLKKGTQDG